MTAPVRLRAHHLICLFGWQGEGYSREFTDNFNAIVSRLSDSALVELVDGADDVCAACPKLASGDCDASDPGLADPGAIDARVLDCLGLDVGGVHSFGSLVETVRTRIAPQALSAICRGCSWEGRGWCAAGLERSRTAG